jgi:hypothetical protein
MTWTFFRTGMPLAFAGAVAGIAVGAAGLATAPLALADCPNDQVVDADSGQCAPKDNAPKDNAPKDNANSEAPLKAAWEDAFGPLPSPEDFALARVDDPTVALPGVGLPGVGVNLLSVAPSFGAGAAAASALPSIAPAPVGLPAPSIPEVGLPALPAPPPLPGPPCVGFGTPIPFVGFSTC